MSFGFLSNENFAQYLLAADYFVYPCRNINNSGSLNAALSAGLPIIVPAMEELNWIPNDCKLVFENQNDSASQDNLKELLNQLPQLDHLKYIELHKSAIKWSDARTWESVAAKYRSLYREILNA
jgi:glycosyltransferase involved in cell wall biosynthesis